MHDQIRLGDRSRGGSGLILSLDFDIGSWKKGERQKLIFLGHISIS